MYVGVNDGLKAVELFPAQTVFVMKNAINDDSKILQGFGVFLLLLLTDFKL